MTHSRSILSRLIDLLTTSSNLDRLAYLTILVRSASSVNIGIVSRLPLGRGERGRRHELIRIDFMILNDETDSQVSLAWSNYRV